MARTARPMTGEFALIPVELLKPNPANREVVQNEQLTELGLSILRHGCLEPLIVEQVSGGYRILAGHRRLAAAKLVNLTELPRRIRAGRTPPAEAAAIAAVENLQVRRQIGLTVEERFWSKVDKQDGDGCWLWTAARNAEGYGTFTDTGDRKVLAHRWVYAVEVGPVPDGLTLDHLCRVRHCVRPSHLEPLPIGDNTRRGLNGVLTTHCPAGHPYDEVNTYIHRGHRYCRACNRAAARRSKARRKGVLL